MKLYKLTDANDRTYGDCQWGENVTVKTSGEGALCDKGFTHWYTDPLLAVILNPIHAGFDLTTAHLWEDDDDGGIAKEDCGLKVGRTVGTTMRRIALPVVTTEQRIRFAILCVMEIYHEPTFEQWAKGWLSGADRTAGTWLAQPAPNEGAIWAAARAWAAAQAAAAGASAEAVVAAAEAAHTAARLEQLDLIALAKRAVEP